jgi:hypothetical protein
VDLLCFGRTEKWLHGRMSSFIGLHGTFLALWLGLAVLWVEVWGWWGYEIQLPLNLAVWAFYLYRDYPHFKAAQRWNVTASTGQLNGTSQRPILPKVVKSIESAVTAKLDAAIYGAESLKDKNRDVKRRKAALKEMKGRVVTVAPVPHTSKWLARYVGEYKPSTDSWDYISERK